GFHGLSTVFQAISLYDVVTASDEDPGGSGRTVDDGATVTVASARSGVHVDDVPLDASDLAARAATRLATYLGRPDTVSLHIDKAIPVAGGLAGGSADAAGALLACNDLWDANVAVDTLRRLAADLGSDVPFAVTGGTAVGQGRGETVRAVPVEGSLAWVVVVGTGGLSTPVVYRRLDEMRANGRVRPRPEPLARPDALCEALAAGDVETVAACLDNDMDPAARDLEPDLGRVLTAGRAAGALAAMVSGSGPTCVFLAHDVDSAGEIAATL